MSRFSNNQSLMCEMKASRHGSYDPQATRSKGDGKVTPITCTDIPMTHQLDDDIFKDLKDPM
jgi:hypothetical protein